MTLRFGRAKTTLIKLFATLLALLPALGPARAQESFPSRPVHIFVPFAPGGAVDIVARTLGEELSGRWKQAVVVENRPGAGGVVASEAAAKAAPDGYTLIIVATGHALNPHLYAKLPYDLFADFTPITLIGTSPNMALVRSDSPIKSIADLVGAARARPGEISYGHAGNGTSPHLAGELLKSMAKIEMPDASDGIDQPLYVPETGLFYASVPIWKEDKKKGGLAVFDPKTLKMTKLIPIEECNPLGLAQGPGTKVIVGCGAGSKTRTPELPNPITVIIDVATEKVVKVIHELGGQDEVWYNPTTRQYYTASRDLPSGPVLGVINADTDTFVESIPTGENAHSVAADAKNNAIFVPLTAPNPACANGCIGVYQIK